VGNPKKRAPEITIGPVGKARQNWAQKTDFTVTWRPQKGLKKGSLMLGRNALFALSQWDKNAEFRFFGICACPAACFLARCEIGFQQAETHKPLPTRMSSGREKS
jgi:hypothetical protein